MAEIKESKSYKESTQTVLPHLGPDRGKKVMVKWTPHGVWVKPKNARQERAVFVSWGEVHSAGVESISKANLKKRSG